MTLFSDLHLDDDPTTLVLLGLLILLVGPPGIFMIVRRLTRPPLQAESFRWLYLAWACLLAASSVWNISREARLSVEEAGADNFIRLAFLLLGGLIILLIGAKYRFVFLKELAAGALGIFFVFALWGLASTLWSVSPAGTFYKSSEYCAMLVIFALAISLVKLASKDPRGQLLALKSVFDWNWLLIFLLLVNVYVGILIWPDLAVLQAYRDEISLLGFSIQSVLPGISENSLGQLAAILAIVALARIVLEPRSRVVFIPILALALTTAILTQSRSPILGFLIAAAAVLIASRRFGLLALSSSLVAAVLLTRYGQTVYEFLRRGQDPEEVATLTGRVTYWEASVEAVRESWINGYGAYAGGRYVLQSIMGISEGSTVHSMYAEALVDTGVVGLTILLIGLGVTWFWLFRIRSYIIRDPVGRLLWLESFGVLTVLSVRSIFSVPFAWSFHVLTFGLVLIFIEVARRQVVQRRYAGAPVAQSVPATRRRRSSIRG